MDINGNIKEVIGIRHDITDIMNPKKQLLDDIKNLDSPTLILAQMTNYNIIKEFYSEEIRNRFEDFFSKELLRFFPEHLNIKKVYILGNGLFGFLLNEKREIDYININLTKILKELKRNDIEFEGNKYQMDIFFSFTDKGKNLFDDALIGLERVKKSKNNIIYAENYYRITQIEARKKLKTLMMIRDVLKEKDKVLSYYQPIVCNKTKEILKYESLIRILDKKNEVLTPLHFIDLAKKTGYYHELTLRVIENANQILKKDSKISISINLSSSDIEDLEIRDELFSLVSDKNNKNRVTFELLEDEDVKDFEVIKNFIEISKVIGGVKISIDDFGSGYSNFERLSMFQPDFIKIDGSLIKDITTNTYNQSVVKSIVLFAKENSLKTIAEFVSNEDIYKVVKELGIDYSQGYLFGKPEPLS